MDVFDKTDVGFQNSNRCGEVARAINSAMVHPAFDSEGNESTRSVNSRNLEFVAIPRQPDKPVAPSVQVRGASAVHAAPRAAVLALPMPRDAC